MTESPIEADLFDALVRICRDQSLVILHSVSFENFDREVKTDPRCRLHVATQVRFGRYRADFIIGKGIKRICVECDGAEFHRATAEQVSRDVQRDQWMAERGVETIRFSGKQIVRDVYKCAHQALRAAGVEDLREGDAMQVGVALSNVLLRCVDEFEARQ